MFKDALKRNGWSYLRLSRALGVHNTTVMRWADRGRIPLNRIIQIEAVTGISRETICPELYECTPSRPDLYPENGGERR